MHSRKANCTENATLYKHYLKIKFTKENFQEIGIKLYNIKLYCNKIIRNPKDVKVK